MSDKPKLTKEQKKEIAERYKACRTTTEKNQLAEEYRLPVAVIYNIYSRSLGGEFD